ncbi:MAG: MttB6 [Thermoanaerobacterales bacterium 50_218]|nr:MAG: MttB6 [Thermoanaerobacterales bacterium 50_218]HAA89071.1 hypothetical protein [Peptococcaceae bacterium]
MLQNDGQTIKESTSKDMRLIAKVVDYLPQIDLQSTAVVCADIPYEVGDLYRLYLIMKESKKPVITGAFSVSGVRWMRELMKVMRKSEEDLAQKPYAIFDICPSPPLRGHTSVLRISLTALASDSRLNSSQCQCQELVLQQLLQDLLFNT